MQAACQTCTATYNGRMELNRAFARLASLQSDPGERARRVEQAGMLEAAQAPRRGPGRQWALAQAAA